MSDCLIVGAGVVGLSLAYELAGQGLAVRVIDAGEPGREASWAGAGILPPASGDSPDPLERLTALSNRLHARWSETFRGESGVDNGYRACGAFYLARTEDDARQLAQLAGWAAARGIEARKLSAGELTQLEANLHPTGPLAAAYLVPGECQLRNPRHLKALLAACETRGVEISPHTSAEDFEITGDRVRAVCTAAGRLSADRFCLTSGSWSAALARKLGVTVAIKPIRGQMVLMRLERPPLERIVNEGNRYLVPRGDGRLLVGSTEEDVGFDRSNTDVAIADLIEFAKSLVPSLADAPVEKTWAGLRPATADGLPYLGRVPGLENAFLAAGHFRGGLQLSTGTAVVIGQLMLGREPAVELESFRPGRSESPRPSLAAH